MTIQQFNRANDIRTRIYRLKVMKASMGRQRDKTQISDVEIPKNSYDVILALCEREISDLEEEFEQL